MANNLHKTLIALGLTNNEVQVYLGLLKISGGQLPEIARASGVKRTTVYSVIDQLRERRLARKVNRGTREYFYPVNPYELLDRQLQIYNDLEAALPLLERLSSNIGSTQSLKTYENGEEVEELWSIILQCSSNIDSVLDLTQSLLVADDTRHYQLTKHRLQHNLLHRCLVSSLDQHPSFREADSSVLRKSLPCDLIIGYDLHLFDDKVCLISPDGLSGLLLEGKTLHSVVSELFHALWNKLLRTSASSEPLKKEERAASVQYGLARTERAAVLMEANYSNAESIVSDLKSGKAEPRSVPIPRRTADFTMFNFGDTQLAAKLDESKLVNLLDRGFYGSSYYRTNAVHDPQFRRNIRSASTTIEARESALKALSEINRYLAKFDMNLYLLAGHRTLECQIELWETYYEHAKNSFRKIYSGKELNQVARDYTNRYIPQPSTTISENEPETWYPMGTGGSIIATLCGANGYPLELGVQNLDLGIRSHPYYYEVHRPQTETEQLIQENRRMFFWAAAIHGWICSPHHIAVLHSFKNLTTTAGVAFANLFGLLAPGDKTAVNAGPIAIS